METWHTYTAMVSCAGKDALYTMRREPRGLFQNCTSGVTWMPFLGGQRGHCMYQGEEERLSSVSGASLLIPLGNLPNKIVSWFLLKAFAGNQVKQVVLSHYKYETRQTMVWVFFWIMNLMCNRLCFDRFWLSCRSQYFFHTKQKMRLLHWRLSLVYP